MTHSARRSDRPETAIPPTIETHPPGTDAAIAEADAHTAHNYHPLPVVLARGEGAWVEDVEGRRYLDMLAGYSALNFGHRNPRLVEAVERQLGRITLTSRAFHNDLLGTFTRELAELCGMDMVLPMNTGAEAVETALKMARKWGHEVKGVPEGRARIITMDGNFHGRTTTIVGFSSDPSARKGFGPFTPGFVSVPYGDAELLAAAIDEDTVAVLLEPIQGEGGVIIPPDGYLAEVAPPVHRAQRPDARGRDPVGPRAAPARRSPATTRASCPTRTSWARRWAAGSCPCPRWSPGPT